VHHDIENSQAEKGINQAKGAVNRALTTDYQESGAHGNQRYQIEKNEFHEFYAPLGLLQQPLFGELKVFTLVIGQFISTRHLDRLYRAGFNAVTAEDATQHVNRVNFWVLLALLILC
jgi:hypothetical protein